jgi:mycothiol synthase
MVMYKSEVAAAAVGFDSEIGGWIKQLAVKKDHRGKGLASFILKQLFYDFNKLGRSDVGLTVDSENRTGAPELYLRVGMQPTEKYVTFVRAVPH